jgi:hypothetical protein
LILSNGFDHEPLSLLGEEWIDASKNIHKANKVLDEWETLHTCNMRTMISILSWGSWPHLVKEVSVKLQSCISSIIDCNILKYLLTGDRNKATHNWHQFFLHILCLNTKAVISTTLYFIC